MTTFQKAVKYLAMAFAIFLIVSIFGGILSALGMFGGFFGDDAVTGDLKTYEVSPEIRSLEVEIGAADFTIRQGESFSVESNLKHLTVKDKNGVLTIREKGHFGRVDSDAVLTLQVPGDTVFERVSLDTGAGKLTADRLSASEIDLDLGAGNVEIRTLIATSRADIDGGAGKITVSDGALRNLDLEMGAGQFNLTSALTGEAELDLGVGESNITVIGDRDDYRLDIEKGVGSITVDGTQVSNFKDRGNGKHSISVDGGVGAIHLTFKESGAK